MANARPARGREGCFQSTPYVVANGFAYHQLWGYPQPSDPFAIALRLMCSRAARSRPAALSNRRLAIAQTPNRQPAMHLCAEVMRSYLSGLLGSPTPSHLASVSMNLLWVDRLGRGADEEAGSPHGRGIVASRSVVSLRHRPMELRYLPTSHTPIAVRSSMQAASCASRREKAERPPCSPSLRMSCASLASRAIQSMRSTGFAARP